MRRGELPGELRAQSGRAAGDQRAAGQAGIRSRCGATCSPPWLACGPVRRRARRRPVRCGPWCATCCRRDERWPRPPRSEVSGVAAADFVAGCCLAGMPLENMPRKPIGRAVDVAARDGAATGGEVAARGLHEQQTDDGDAGHQPEAAQRVGQTGQALDRDQSVAGEDQDDDQTPAARRRTTSAGQGVAEEHQRQPHHAGLDELALADVVEIAGGLGRVVVRVLVLRLVVGVDEQVDELVLEGEPGQGAEHRAGDGDADGDQRPVDGAWARRGLDRRRGTAGAAGPAEEPPGRGAGFGAGLFGHRRSVRGDTAVVRRAAGHLNGRWRTAAHRQPHD